MLDEATDEIYRSPGGNHARDVVWRHVRQHFFDHNGDEPDVPFSHGPLVEWTAFDVAPDGRWYVMGNSSFELAGTGHDRQVAYSYDHGITWDQFDLAAPGPPGGVFGADIVFLEQPTGSQFSVACGDVVSHAYGIEGTDALATVEPMGAAVPTVALCVLIPPGRDDLLHVQPGRGVLHGPGTSAENMCDGMLAIQVNDIDMTVDKQHAWVASKSGVRRVSELLPTKAWSGAVWPIWMALPTSAWRS